MKMGSRSRTGLGTVGSLALIIPAHLWRSMTSLRLVYEWLCNTKEESQIPVRGCAPECSIWEAGCGFSIILYTDSAAGEKKLGFLCIIKGKTNVISLFSAAGGPNWSIFPYKSSVINCKSVSFASRVVIRLVHLHISEK